MAPVDLPALDLPGLAAAMAAGGAARMQAKQHQSLATVHGVAADELATIRVRAETVTSEEERAMSISDTDEAITREHISWRASRGGFLATPAGSAEHDR